MTTKDVFPLLELPGGVEAVLLPFVASGTGGLQSLLNLRLVCSTTKSWVDSLPPRQGKPLFSKAQVRMHSQGDTLQRFLESEPPSALSALSLDIGDVLDKNPPGPPEELWNKFCGVWAHRLQILELKKDPEDDDDDYEDIFYNNRRISSLLESSNLRVVRLGDIFIRWNSSTVFPSCLYKVKELSIKFCGPYEEDESMARFYAELLKNTNLRKYETVIHSHFDFEVLQKFIDAKKEDAQLEMNLKLWGTFPDAPFDDFDEEEDGEAIYYEVYQKFARSVGASKSTIRLQLLEQYNLESAYELLPRDVALEMFEKVEVVEIWMPTEDTLSLLEDLPRLKVVSVETIFGGVECSRLEELTFPPSLELLSFSRGFPARGNLPEGLRSLTLEKLSCNAAELANSLTFLKSRCPRLETLKITWECVKSEDTPENIEESPGFANLRVLKFEADVDENAVESCRAVLLRGFQVETLQLTHLDLCFQLKGGGCVDGPFLPVLDVPVLTGFCEGAVGSSLVMCDIRKESVASEGIPLLERLTGSAAANAKSRVEREGRGRWLQM